MYRPHELCLLMPPMTEAEYDGLVSSIRETGHVEPIVLIDDEILDGRHRERACRDLGIEPPTVQYSGPRDPESLVRYVLAHNLHRRSLTTSQRAVVAAAAADWLKQVHKEGIPLGECSAGVQKCTRAEQEPNKQATSVSKLRSDPLPKEMAQVAKEFGVSRRVLFQAVALHRTGNRELAEAVRRGEITVNAAYKRVVESREPDSDSWSAVKAQRGAFHDIINSLKHVENKVVALSRREISRELDRDSIVSGIRSVIALVEDAIPERACSCGGRPGCPVCLGQGWMSRAQAREEGKLDDQQSS